eukprot:754879-Hanusia_phi.AAC.1
MVANLGLGTSLEHVEVDVGGLRLESAGDSSGEPEVCAGSVLVISVGRHQASSLGVADLVWQARNGV